VLETLFFWHRQWLFCRKMQLLSVRDNIFRFDALTRRIVAAAPLCFDAFRTVAPQRLDLSHGRTVAPQRLNASTCRLVAPSHRRASTPRRFDLSQLAAHHVAAPLWGRCATVAPRHGAASPWHRQHRGAQGDQGPASTPTPPAGPDLKIRRRAAPLVHDFLNSRGPPGSPTATGTGPSTPRHPHRSRQ
jgi:hypothetical protein